MLGEATKGGQHTPSADRPLRFLVQRRKIVSDTRNLLELLTSFVQTYSVRMQKAAVGEGPRDMDVFTLWVLLAQLLVIGVVAWIFRMPDGAIPVRFRSGWNRVGGNYHRLVRGKLWEPGEQERYRVRLVKVTAYTIDRHVPVQRRATCVVTDQRVVLDDAHATPIQIHRDEIRTVRVGRTYDTREGFIFWVAVERTGSHVHEPEGDVCLVCASQAESRALASAIEREGATVTHA